MSTLLLRLEAPLQSYGTQDRFVVRGTDLEPSFSGVVGLVAAALGRSEMDPISDLAELQMGVRVDRPGETVVDFHTIRGGKDGTGGPADVVVSYRHYLTDARFLVGLSGSRELLGTIANALMRPHASLFLGRRACCLAAPLAIPNGLREEDLESLLCSYPWLSRWGSFEDDPPARVRLQLPATAETATAVRMDHPLSFAARAYAPRHVRNLWTPVRKVA